MKISEICNNIDKSVENEAYVDIFKLFNELNICADDYKEDHKIKSYWVGNWCCTDSIVGFKIYFLDDTPICFSKQLARKAEEEISWFNKEVVLKTKEYLNTIIIGDSEYDNINYIDINEDIGDSYKIHYNADILKENKPTLNGEDIKIIKRIRKANDYGIDKELLILQNNKEKIININDIDFKFYIKDTNNGGRYE